MKNRLVGLLVFALVAFNLYAQSDQSKKGFLLLPVRVLFPLIQCGKCLRWLGIVKIKIFG